MAHQIHCPHCKKNVQIADDLVGMQTRCPACRKLIDPANPGNPVPAVVKPASSAQGTVPKPAAAGVKLAAGPGPGPKPAAPTAQGTAPKPPLHAPAPKAPPAPAGSLQATYRPLLEAVALAARAHRHQLRKDDRTPYVSHVFRVALVVRQVFGIDDPHVLMAAALHDAIEDTTTDYDDLKKDFGDEVANYVAVLTKDKRREETRREEAYRQNLGKGPWQVHVCKLADIFDNLMDSVHTSPDQRAKTLQRSREYLAALAPVLVDQSRRPHELVSQLLTEMEAIKFSRVPEGG